VPNLKLTYFDSPGRAEPVRVALKLGGVPFEDVRLQFPQFAEAKARGDFPLGALPVLDVDGVRIAETASILRYVARLGDAPLYPSDPWKALLVDSALDALNDTFSHALLPSLFERDPAKKLAMRAELAAGKMKLVFDYVEGLIATSGGPFVAGAELSIADLVVALQVLQIRSGRLDGLTEGMLADWPRLGALTDAYLAHPGVAALAR
jgi:glutathione S-transferase